ncbi:MAG: DUF2235 domain-containing protein [Pseudomonadota bacterium]
MSPCLWLDLNTAGMSRNLIFLCDGTLSSLKTGEESNLGQVLRLLQHRGERSDQIVSYDRGIQGDGWRRWVNAASGKGINLSIRNGYRFLAKHYRPGDRIYLFGYSRGAYAVRSLAGMIGTIGLLKEAYATERHAHLAFRFYEVGSQSTARQHFSNHRCHQDVPIEMLGVWDTVKSLGLPYPLLNRLAPMATEFHNHELGAHILHGYHALAIDEDRSSFAPILWEQSPDWQGRLEQTWFPGAHGDVGGQVSEKPMRGLSNISLNWMLRRAELHGVCLPEGWKHWFPEDPTAPMLGCRSGIARLFILREARRTGQSDGETIHLSIRDRAAALPRYRPRGSIEAG